MLLQFPHHLQHPEYFKQAEHYAVKDKIAKTKLKIGSGFQPCFTVEDFQRKCKNYKQT